MESNSSRPDSASKKRLLFIVTLNELGGAQKFVFTLVNALDPQKYDITVSAGNNSTGEFLKSFKTPVCTHILKNLKRDPSFWTDIKTIFEVRNLIRNMKPDTLFLNSSKVGFIGSLATVFPSKLKNGNRKLKIIYRIGGWTFNDPWPEWKKRLWIYLEKISAKWKDVIIVNSNRDLEQAHKLKIRPSSRLVLVHNGIDVYKIQFFNKEEARLKLFERIAKYSGKIFQIKYVIGSIANFYPTKGLEYLIEAARAFKNNPEIAFVVIGDGPERKNYETKIMNYGLQNKFFLIGQLTDAHKYLLAFDIFVLPSIKEGFPWALIEAMSAKLPVISTKTGAVTEIIEDGKNGFTLEPRNSNQIVGKINQIINDDHLKLELGIQAHQTVLFKFGLEKMISQIEDLF